MANTWLLERIWAIREPSFYNPQQRTSLHSVSSHKTSALQELFWVVVFPSTDKTNLPNIKLQLCLLLKGRNVRPFHLPCLVAYLSHERSAVIFTESNASMSLLLLLFSVLGHFGRLVGTKRTQLVKSTGF